VTKHSFPNIATLFLGLAVANGAMAEPPTVIVVRHAERATEPANDPSLSPAGFRRAAQLADALTEAKIAGIITTNLRRTKETAAPLAQKLGIEPQVVAIREGEPSAHVPEIVAALGKLNGNTLVVAHSNTAAEIVTALTGVTLLPLCDTSFSHVFVINTATKAVAKLRYSEMDPKPGDDGCQ